MRLGIPGRLLNLLSLVGMILLSLLIIALGEILPPMPAVQRFQEANPAATRFLIALAVALTGLGTLLLAFTQFLVRVPDPRRAPRAQTSKTKGRLKGRGWSFSGAMLSAGFSDEARMWRVKQAFREGEWWSAPRWRRLTLMMLGAILTFYGLFGLLFLLFPPGMKFSLFLVALYATLRSVYAFAVDQPSRQVRDDAEN